MKPSFLTAFNIFKPELMKLAAMNTMMQKSQTQESLRTEPEKMNVTLSSMNNGKPDLVVLSEKPYNKGNLTLTKDQRYQKVQKYLVKK